MNVCELSYAFCLYYMVCAFIDPSSLLITVCKWRTSFGMLYVLDKATCVLMIFCEATIVLR